MAALCSGPSDKNSSFNSLFTGFLRVLDAIRRNSTAAKDRVCERCQPLQLFDLSIDSQQVLVSLGFAPPVPSTEHLALLPSNHCGADLLLVCERCCPEIVRPGVSAPKPYEFQLARPTFCSRRRMLHAERMSAIMAGDEEDARGSFGCRKEERRALKDAATSIQAPFFAHCIG